MSSQSTEQSNISEIHRLDDDISSEIITNIKKVLRDDDIDFSGDLSKSVQTDVLDEIRYVVVDSPYALVVDKGMPPGRNVNFDALKKWVEGKLGVSAEESPNVTMKIMNKIKTTGIKPKFFAKKAIMMVIGKHGVPSIQKNKKTPVGRGQKALNKVSRTMKKVNRFTKKINKNINKVDKGIKRLGKV
jgi:hypothetical protein